MNETRVCHICGTEVEKRESCPVCVASVPGWKSPSLMTPEERLAEWYMWNNPAILEIPFDMMSERIDALIGRPVWTHELIEYDALAAEIMGEKEPPTIEQITELLERRMPGRVIVFDPDGSLGDHAQRN